MATELTEELFFRDLKTGKDRREMYADEWDSISSVDIGFAQDLIRKVNALLKSLEAVGALPADFPIVVTSGWRPISVNNAIHGASHSLHLCCRAVDIADPHGKLDAACASRPDLLRAQGLWLEDPGHTPGWTHLDTGARGDRPSRIFTP